MYDNKRFLCESRFLLAKSQGQSLSEQEIGVITFPARSAHAVFHFAYGLACCALPCYTPLRAKTCR